MTPNFQKSPTGEVAVGSNASVVARIVMLAVAAAALPAPYGPTSDGTANQRPWVTGVVARPSGNPAVALVPGVLSSSGSPG